MPTSLGPAEILVILVVALIVLGPKRLPEAARQVGKTLAEVRKWSQGVQDEVRSAINPESAPPSYSAPPLPVLPAETAPPPDAAHVPDNVASNGHAPAAPVEDRPSADEAEPPAGDPPRT
jgi:Tat protein translocase TatB subunit